MVMMVMMTIKPHVSITFISRVWTRRVLMMMMVSAGLCALRAARGRAAACAILVGFAFVILGLAALAARSRLCRRLRRMLGGIAIFAACQIGVCVCDLGAAGYWTWSADAASYAGEHTAELALNSGFVGRSWQLWLGALDGLWKRRNSTLTIDLLNAQQTPRLPTRWRRPFLGRTRSRVHICGDRTVAVSH